MRYIFILAAILSFSAAHATIVGPNVYFDSSDNTIKGDNPNYISLSLQVTLNLSNMSSSEGANFNVVLPARSTATTMTALASTGSGGMFGFNFNWSYGDYTATPDTFLYALPYAEGASYRVDQGEFGSFSHFGSLNERAIDFTMPVGTPVHAMRDGVVFEVIENFSVGGVDLSLTSSANKISVVHSDGTWVEYVHLQQNGSLVAIGDSVTRGQHIGNSGNTGYSSGPHLHISLVHNSPIGTYQSISIIYETSVGNIVVTEGNFYEAPTPSLVTQPIVGFDGTTLSWQSETGVNYVVEGTEDIGGGWENIFGFPTPGTGGLVSVTLPLANAVQSFRLILAP